MYILLFGLTIVTLAIIHLYGKNGKININGNTEVQNLIKEMCNEYCIETPIIEGGDNFSYNPIKNAIAIKKEFRNSLEHIVASLHEVGHYIFYNNGTILAQLTSKTLPIIIFNRVVILPAYIIVLVASAFNFVEVNSSMYIVLFKYVFFAFFILASVIRLTIGIYNEIIADHYVLGFLKKASILVEIKSVKLLMTLAIISQVLLALTWISAIMLIYELLFI